MKKLICTLLCLVLLSCVCVSAFANKPHIITDLSYTGNAVQDLYEYLPDDIYEYDFIKSTLRKCFFNIFNALIYINHDYPINYKEYKESLDCASELFKEALNKHNDVKDEYLFKDYFRNAYRSSHQKEYDAIIKTLSVIPQAEEV